MRWLITIVVFDLAVVVWLAVGSTRESQADFTYVCAGAHRFLDPQRISWMHDIRVAECLFEPLVRIKLPEMAVEPAVAETWQVSDDGRTYTFNLRPDARWHNGDAVTAGGFIYAWRRALLPDMAADYSQLLWRIEGAEAFFNWRADQLGQYAVGQKNLAEAEKLLEQAYRRFEQTVGLHAPNDHTLVVTLAQPVPYFLQLCAFVTFMPVHQVSVEPQTSLDIESGRLIQDPYWTRPQHLICNGPYYLKRRRFKRDLLLDANPHYWNQAAVTSSAILERIVANPGNALLLYEAGQIDWLPDIPSTGALAGNLVQQRRPDVHVTAAAGTYFYNFNCQPKFNDGSDNPLVDPRLRRALSMAIDRRTLVDNITRLGQPPAQTFVPMGALPGYAPPAEAGCRFDPDQAIALLSEAGYGPGGKPLEGLSILYNTGHGHEQIAQAIKRGWEQYLGVNVKLEGLEGAVFGDRLRNHNFAIARAGWFGDYLDPTTFLDKFRTDNGNNDAAYTNREFDALMNAAAGETDAVKRMAILRQAEALMLKEQPIAPIYQYVNFNVFDPERIEGLHLNPWNYRRLELVKTR